MKEENYKLPEFRKESFHCPYCRVLATQEWNNDVIFLKNLYQYQYQIFLNYRETIGEYTQGHIRDFLSHAKPSFLSFSNRPYFVARCLSCKNYSFWVNEKMVHPLVSNAPAPNADMPENVKELYEEARNVQPHSARAAAALLRVALEKLTEDLGETKGSLYIRIGNLKKQGLPKKVIQGLDIVRIVANEGGAHAGQIDLTGKDNQKIVNKLFFLVNFIVEKTITEGKQIETSYSNLPQDKKTGINNRDKQE